jgi:hypothetical protein
MAKSLMLSDWLFCALEAWQKRRKSAAVNTLNWLRKFFFMKNGFVLIFEVKIINQKVCRKQALRSVHYAT